MTNLHDKEKGKKIDFDEIRTEKSIIDFSTHIWWIKNKEVIKEMQVSEEMQALYPICPSCLKWYGKIVQMTKRKELILKDESYTFLQCPECFGLDSGSECTCGESPHRIKCPMGFYLYFNNL